jgi:ABC-type branched-subunit amino acid transport system substrate-binding protein
MKVGVPTVLGESNTAFLDVAQYPAYFTPLASAAQYATEYVAFAKAHGFTKIGELTDGTPIGNQASQKVQEQARAAGLQVVSAIAYSPTAPDLTTQMRQLQAAGTQLLIENGYAGVNNVFAALNQIGWSPTVLGIGLNYAAPKTVGALASKTFPTCFYYYTTASEQPTGVANELLSDMVKIVGADTPAASTVLPFYDILLTLKAGIEEAKSLNYEAVVKALETGHPIKSVWPNAPTFRYTTTNHEGYPNGQVRTCKFSPIGAKGTAILNQ